MRALSYQVSKYLRQLNGQLFVINMKILWFLKGVKNLSRTKIVTKYHYSSEVIHSVAFLNNNNERNENETPAIDEDEMAKASPVWHLLALSNLIMSLVFVCSTNSILLILNATFISNSNIFPIPRPLLTTGNSII